MNNDFFSRHGFKVLLVIAFLAPMMLAGTRRSLQSNSNDVKAWLPDAYEETAVFKWYQQHFEGDTFVMVSWEGCTLDSPALSLMAKKLQPPPVPENQPWPTEPEFFSSVRTGKDILQMLIDEQGLEPEEAVNRLRGFLIGQDGKQTCLLLTISASGQERWEAEWAAGKRKQKFLHAALDRIRQVASQECAIPEADLHMGGPPVDNVAIDLEGQRSLYRLAGVSAVVGILMSWWCLRHWGLTYMVFTCGLFTAGCSLAVVYLTGTRMNAILLTMPSLVYVAAISGAIHLANYYRDEVRQHGLEGAPTRAVKAAWLPLFLATATTAIGLASMYISELVPIQLFGLYSAIGVGISFVIVCTYMPAMLQWIPIRS
ncbi:MAG TPA: MMPL family transporter, partial [Thermoguttaceae bacterium]|nr:MMPL family transporter [Thermoguttaceae bacterium]